MAPLATIYTNSQSSTCQILQLFSDRPHAPWWTLCQILKCRFSQKEPCSQDDQGIGIPPDRFGRRVAGPWPPKRADGGGVALETRPRVPAFPGEILRNSPHGRPTCSAIRKTTSWRFCNQTPQTLGRDPVRGNRRQLAKLRQTWPLRGSIFDIR